MTVQEDPRRALSLTRLARARQHLKSAGHLLANADYGDSISRSYYAIFQAARALLATQQLDSRKHSGVIALFNRHFVKDGKVEKRLGVILMDARRAREIADYSDVAEFSPEEAEAQLRDAEMFVDKIATALEGESQG